MSDTQNDPHEIWKEIEDFPGYSVSDKGRVRNDVSGHIMTQSQNQYNVVRVQIVNAEGKQENRSVPLLVAKHHLQLPPDESVFDTLINLDGDRFNNRVENLMWRPRWFALKYAQQFKDDARTGFKVPIQTLSTGDIFPNSMAAAMRFGILAEDTVKSVINGKSVFPTYQKFKLLNDVDDRSNSRVHV